MAVQWALVDAADPVAPPPPVDLSADDDVRRGWELTTVSTRAVVMHRGPEVACFDDLEPATTYTFNGLTATTLSPPAGRLRTRFATVNDVHFGEFEAGRLGDSDLGPIQRVAPGDEPYPEVMNRGAVAEIAADVAADGRRHEAVFVKGDLTNAGTPAEFAEFAACYAGLGQRLHVVRGNHDGYAGQTEYAGDHWVELDGVNVALLDTVIPRAVNGTLRAEQLDWLDAQLAASTVPVMLLGHHPPAIHEDPAFFLDAEATGALDDLAVRHPAVVAYAAGHSHRQRVVPMPRSGALAIEIGCVKDFPGAWASYDVYDGGIVQLTHRISTPAALRWSEQCRVLYRDFGLDYTDYALGAIDQRCFVIPWR